MPISFLRRHGPALLLFVALTGVMCFQILDIMARGGVPGWEGDNLFYVHSMWWWKHALIDLHSNPFHDMEAYYPVGRANGRSEMTAVTTILGLPVTLVFGPVVAYDVMLLVSFVLTGFFTYLWVHELTGRRDGAVLAGVVAAFMPIRYAHLVGHLPEMGTQWLPLTLYAFERFLARQTIRRALLLGLGVTCVALGCWYYSYTLAIMFPVYSLVRTWRSPVWRTRPWWTGLAAAAGLAAVLLAPSLYEMFKLHGEGALGRRLSEMDSWSLNPYDLFIPNALHPIFGDAASRWFPRERALWVERGVTVGMTAAVLALCGWLGARRKAAAMTTLAATWVVASLIALGPTLHWNEQQVRIPVPRRVALGAARQLTGAGSHGDVTAMRNSFLDVGVPVPLPALFMFKYVPLTSSMRVMARFALWTGFMTAALAGFGLIALAAWGERRWGPAARGAIAVLAVAVVLFESLTVFPLEPLAPRAVDTWLATQPDSVVIVELPVDQAERMLQNYWRTINHKKNLFGPVGDSFPAPVELERVAALKEFPAPSTLAYLQRSPATHLLVTPSQVPNWPAIEPVLRTTPTLADERQIGDVRVYRIVH